MFFFNNLWPILSWFQVFGLDKAENQLLNFRKIYFSSFMHLILNEKREACPLVFFSSPEKSSIIKISIFGYFKNIKLIKYSTDVYYILNI